MSSYAPASFWVGLFRRRGATGLDLNPEGFWATQWLQLLDLPAGQAVLDLGCGTGGDALELARHGLQVVGLDYSRAWARRPRSSARTWVRHCRWRIAAVMLS